MPTLKFENEEEKYIPQITTFQPSVKIFLQIKLKEAVNGLRDIPMNLNFTFAIKIDLKTNPIA